VIDLSLSDDQANLVQVIRQTATKEFPLDEGVRAALDGPAPFDERRWQRLAEIGVFSTGIPEGQGGVGLGSPEEFLVMVELGRAAVSGPVVGTVLAARVAVAGGDGDLAGLLMSGERRAGLLVGDRAVDAAPGDLALRVEGGYAELVEIQEAGALTATDPLTALHRVERARPVLRVAEGRVRDGLRLLTGAYLLGLAETATDMSVEYAKTREQFGRPIGSFQAVKHRCSEMVIRSYPARAQLGVGAVLIDSGLPGSGRLEVAAGLLLALDAARRNVEDNVQNHGGIGFTAEHPAGVLVKRVMTYRHLAGPDAELIREILVSRKTDVA
jgi:alkylation response protein AidB-like acyl-CoA dehydrogenase